MTDETQEQTTDEAIEATEGVTEDAATEDVAQAADVGDEPITEDSEAAAYVAQLEAANKELQAKLAEKVRELEETEQQVQEFKPTADVSKFLDDSDEGIIERFGREKIEDLAQIERVKQNRERSKNGHFPLPPLEGEELEKAIRATIAELQGDKARAQPPNTGPLNRVLKMVDQEGNLREIPYEPQINNMAGSLADGYERYRQKGFKLPEPMLCATSGCSKKAAVNEAGEFEFKAYCSQDHMNRTERDQTQTQVPGVTNRNVLTGAGQRG